MKKSMLLVAVLMTVLGSPCLAARQQDVSLSADGSILVTTVSRAIYVVDTKTMEVKKRIFSPAVVEAHCLDAKGAVLAFRDDADRFQILNLATGKYIKTVKRVASAVCFAPSAQLAAFVERQSGNPPVLVVLSIPTGKEVTRIELPKDFVVARMTFDPKAKQVTMISRSRKGDEEKVPRNKRPSIKDPCKAKEYAQKHDGRVSSLLTVDLVAKTVSKEREIWWTDQGGHGNTMFHRDGKIYFMQYSRHAAVMSEKDEITIEEGPIWCNYGFGVRFGDGAYAVGGLADGAIVVPGKKPVSFKFERKDRLPGFPEYFYGFGFSPTGTVYGITSAMRLVEISAEGKILRIKPVL